MVCILPQRALPGIYPVPEAMKPGNKLGYDPEFWEFEYQAYRYLSRTSDEYLQTRYKCILRNMGVLTTGPNRHVIPIDTFLSSWYWYRKEHQTRYELHHRGQASKVIPDIPAPNVGYTAPYRPRSPNACDFLFRFTARKYAEEMLRDGKIRIGAASLVEKYSDDVARYDKELSKNSFLPGQYTYIKTSNGEKIPIIGDICTTVSLPDYYFLCVACDCDAELFTSFQADSCVIIKNPNIFAQRMEAATRKELPGWEMFHIPVNYYDPYERIKNQHIDAGSWKAFEYAYQREYRFIWFNKTAPASGHHFLSLGSLEDIAEISTFTA